MSEGILGINRSSLWASWKLIRRMVKRASVRDVVDYLEYDIDPEIWIKRLLREIADGSYEPGSPKRFMLAKSKGFSRRMTQPEIRDLVLYRAIVDYLYRRIRHKERKHVYFEIARLSKVTEEAATAARDIEKAASSYGPTSTSRFLAWLNYDQYRKHLIFKSIYPFIVTTDITNYFDTVLHGRIASSLHGISTPSRMVGLLFFLLERLSIRDAFNESPRIGLPVDEFDCSRKLAHIFLFSHDDRMVREVGEDAYVRWMDDQNIGVPSRAVGLKVLAKLGESLGRLHLTPNAGKSRLLTLSEARRHFHLDINDKLDKADRLPGRTSLERKRLGKEIRKIWRKAKKYEGVGEWSKVLKRVYRLAGLARLRMMRRRALQDLLTYPDLAGRISDYIRCTGSVSEYLDFAKAVWGHEEQPYADVNVAMLEGMLRLEAVGSERSQIRTISVSFLRRRVKILGELDCAAIAPLLILRFGDRRSLPLLRECFEKKCDKYPPDVVRATAIVYASYGVHEFEIVQKAAGKLLRNPFATLIRMVEGIKAYKDVPNRWKERFKPHYDSMLERNFIDMRSLLAGRLLALNNRPQIQLWLKDRKAEFLKCSISLYDQTLLDTHL